MMKLRRICTWGHWCGRRRQNEVLCILRTICTTIGSSLTSGAYATSFVLFAGLNLQQLSVMDSAANAAMLLASVLMLFAYNWDRTGLSLLRICSWGCVISPLHLVLTEYLPGNWAFPVLLIGGALASLMKSARNTVEINAAPLLYGRQGYSRLLGISGAAGGIFTLLVSTISVYALRSLEEHAMYRTLFSVATVLAVVDALLTMFHKIPRGIKGDTERQTVNIRKVFTGKYLVKSLPHIFRGIGATGVMLFQVVVLSRIELTSEQNASLISLAIVAGIVGSLLLTLLSRFLKPGTIVMIGFISSAVIMVTAPLLKTALSFFIIYGLMIILDGMANNCTMASVVFACEREELAMMSSLHVMYYSIAYSPAMLLFGNYAENFPFAVLVTAAVFYTAAGILFHTYFRKGV